MPNIHDSNYRLSPPSREVNNKRWTCEHLDLDAVAVRKAADQGNALAQFNLGSMYVTGHGVPQDYVLAYVWFDLAVPQFPASKIKRDLTASRMTPVQIAEAQRLAREWKPKKEQ
jgi:TPR repeat protein